LLATKRGQNGEKNPLTLPLSPAFAEAASRRQASGERVGVRGQNVRRRFSDLAY